MKYLIILLFPLAFAGAWFLSAPGGPATVPAPAESAAPSTEAPGTGEEPAQTAAIATPSDPSRVPESQLTAYVTGCQGSASSSGMTEGQAKIFCHCMTDEFRANYTKAEFEDMQSKVLKATLSFDAEQIQEVMFGDHKNGNTTRSCLLKSTAG